MTQGELKPFEREERFIVVKRKHLRPIEERELRSYFKERDVTLSECVVVESDWPEYETVWQIIENRVTGQTSTDPIRDELQRELADTKARLAEAVTFISDAVAMLEQGTAYDNICCGGGGDCGCRGSSHADQFEHYARAFLAKQDTSQCVSR